MVVLGDIDKGLLNALQVNFPLSREPFAEIGSGMGLEEEVVIQRTARLKERRLIRSIGPVFDPRRLGYHSTLVAMHVPGDKVEAAAGIINEHPGVSHNYLRDDDLNLWFTLAVPQGVELENELLKLVDRVGPERWLNLPALRAFKIGAVFDVAGDGSSIHDGPRPDAVGPSELASELSVAERSVIAELQHDLPITNKPFDAMAQQVGLPIEDFIAVCRSLMERGIIRRYGASISHLNAGFVVNAMVCWKVPTERVEEVADIMAGHSEVSHCYERKSSQGWPYNMFTMLHGRTRDDIERALGMISDTANLKDYKALFTLKEFKKERVRLEV